MGYYKNEAARSGVIIHGHEDAIADKLNLAGFAKLDNVNYPKLKKEILRGWEESNFDFNYLADKSNTQKKRKRNITFGEMPNGSYLMQPAGKQSPPDFLVRDFDGRFIGIEAKSGKKSDWQDQKEDNSTMAPMWNDNLPKLGFIYIYSNQKNNKTTIFLGRDVISSEMIELQNSLCERLNTVVAEVRQQASQLDTYNRGWDLKFRPQNFQGGGLEKCDYFKHRDRERCEQSVLELVR